MVRTHHQHKKRNKNRKSYFFIGKLSLAILVWGVSETEGRVSAVGPQLLFKPLEIDYFGQFQAKQRNKYATECSNLFCYCGNEPPIVSTLPLFGFDGLARLKDRPLFETSSSENWKYKMNSTMNSLAD